MTDKLDRLVADFAEAHHGVVPFWLLRSLRATKDQIWWRIETGRWQRLHDEVYLVAGAPSTWRGDLFAACCAGGPHAVASHRSAAALWGLPGGTTDFVEITCPRWRRTKEDRLVVHE